jgi:hypothetical protein
MSIEVAKDIKVNLRVGEQNELAITKRYGRALGLLGRRVFSRENVKK